MYIRGEEGNVAAIFAINYDITSLLAILVGKPVALMAKEDKIKAIQFLNNAGAFLITKSGTGSASSSASASTRCTAIWTPAKWIIPAKRQRVAPQENRGRRYTTAPGEAYQMDWGFTDVLDYNGNTYRAACFAMICHHCGQRYIEFFPNARQENLFIGTIHAFQYMGMPRVVLTDNMKSVVLHRDLEGHPVWQKDYEAFMKTLGFETKLCKPRHPFTKGKVERLVRFYLCPERRISFDGFVNYEGRRFGVPYSYLIMFQGMEAVTLYGVYAELAGSLTVFANHPGIRWAFRDNPRKIAPPDLEEGYRIFLCVDQTELVTLNGVVKLILDGMLYQMQRRTRGRQESELAPLLFVIDELPQLLVSGPLAQLIQGLRVLRSSRVRMILAFQTIESLETAYSSLCL